MSSITKFFCPSKNAQCSASWVLLILRLVAGIAFLYHGWGKIQNPMTWMGPDATVPEFLQCLAAVSEFGGGIAWILGFLTRLASLGILFTMIVAASLHTFVLHDPFVSMTGGHSSELAIVYLSISLILLVIGPGKFSLDYLFFGRSSQDEGSKV